MPNAHRLRLRCRKCRHDNSKLVANDPPNVLVACTVCGHAWLTRLEALPHDIQEQVRKQIRKL